MDAAPAAAFPNASAPAPGLAVPVYLLMLECWRSHQAVTLDMSGGSWGLGLIYTFSDVIKYPATQLLSYRRGYVCERVLFAACLHVKLPLEGEKAHVCIYSHCLIQNLLAHVTSVSCHHQHAWKHEQEATCLRF